MAYLQKAHEHNLSNPQPSLCLASFYVDRNQSDRAKKVLLRHGKTTLTLFLLPIRMRSLAQHR